MVYLNCMTSSLASIQIAFFFDSSIEIETDKLSVAFKEKLHELNLHSQILDVPKEIPNIPFLLLQGGKEYRINASHTRCDFYYDSRTFRKIEDEKAILKEYAIKIFDVLQENKLKIHRVGNVSTFVVDDTDPNKKIKEKFINTKKSGSFEDLVIRYKEIDKFETLELNILTTISSGEYRFNENNNKAIIVQKDISSNDKQKYNFDNKLFGKLVDKSNKLCTSNVITSLFE